MRLSGFLRSTMLLALASAGWAAACGTDADGVSQCRTIEAARCRAGVACGLVEDVDACLRYTRDHCLHGTATGAPSPGDRDDCVEALERAGACAEDSRRTTAAACSIRLAPGATAANVCDVIVEPEQANDCSFLMPLEVDDDEPTPDPQDAGTDGG
jgi:hypothetical protein